MRPTDHTTDVQSQRVEVPSDPGCYHFRVFSHELGKWMSWGSIPIRVGEDEAQRMSTSLWKMPGGSDVCRIIRIPPQGEQAAADREAQRRSFAHGNVSIDNPDVTRELVDAVADASAATVSADSVIVSKPILRTMSALLSGVNIPAAVSVKQRIDQLLKGPTDEQT